jgi:hypothetical protein
MCIAGTVQCPVSIKQFENPFLASLGLVCKADLETAFVPHAGPGLSNSFRVGLSSSPGLVCTAALESAGACLWLALLGTGLD